MIALKKEDIVLNKQFNDKIEAIEGAGALLKEQGYISEEYIEKMIERDALTSTFIGNMVAIPHGTDDAKKFISESGIVLIQVPNGVSFDGNEVKLIIGIAGIENEHLELLSEIAMVCSEIENVEKIIAATSEEEIMVLFQGGLVA
ncbi:PTS sugar transporter subunit IIA [Enterococcus rivorum]|uniref:Mannitol-specific phosphotransferase enzyme IIA component n=1 Tax=Enterococcus rivorum TaxID=762845 RepID=A0A1E5KZQ3_9ENTE|nr:PTS sugar transporter subunit IIA [Enterococcus rivorum]MBP2099243.1 mannitol/fructose-specific phosphotransferase system IIA component [Enterococcus rivorum]OEH83377.1 PTS mannitol transporter subunit IIA [Enterococcus rivorum]